MSFFAYIFKGQPAGKGLTSWLSFVVSSVSLSLSHWYPGSGVVLDCIDSWSLQPYLLQVHVFAGLVIIVSYPAGQVQYLNIFVPWKWSLCFPVFNLTNNIEVESTKKMVDNYKKENKDIIQKNKSKMVGSCSMVNFVKLRTLHSFSFQTKCWLSGLELIKCSQKRKQGRSW